MKEPLWNMGGIHRECAEKRVQEWQKKKTRLKPGDFVKTHFEDETGSREHMWVLIKTINGDLITGELNNDPQIVTALNCGDTVTIHRRDISDHEQS